MIQQTMISILVFACIGAQIPNTYYVFRYFSSFEGRMKEVQSGIFCGIIALLILYCALTGQHGFAAVGAVIESFLNIWYYDHNWRNIGKQELYRIWIFKINVKKLKANYVGYFLAIIMPLFIWFTAWQLTMNPEWLLN